MLLHDFSPVVFVKFVFSAAAILFQYNAYSGRMLALRTTALALGLVDQLLLYMIAQ